MQGVKIQYVAIENITTQVVRMQCVTILVITI